MLEIFQVVAIAADLNDRITEIEVKTVMGKTLWRLTHQQAIMHIKDGVVFYGKVGRQIFPVKVKKSGKGEYLHGCLPGSNNDLLLKLPSIEFKEDLELKMSGRDGQH